MTSVDLLSRLNHYKLTPSNKRRSVCGGAVYKLASATQGAKYKIIILQQTTNFFSS